MANVMQIKMRVPRAHPPFSFHVKARPGMSNYYTQRTGVQSYYRQASFPMPAPRPAGMGAFYQATPVAAPAPPAPTSWFSSSTTIGGYTLSNSTLALGGVAAAAFLFWHSKKHHR